jgi:hypothetical protein
MSHLLTHRSRLRTAVTAGALTLGLALSVASPASAAPSAASVTVAATPGVTVGQTVDVAVSVLGSVDAFSYAVTVDFDPALLAYVDGSASAGPSGGFDSVSSTAGSVTVVHTRLGTSPALAGDLPVTLRLTALGAGDTGLAASVTLVDPLGATTDLPDAATARVAIAALPMAQPPVTSAPAADATPPRNSAPVAVRRNADGSLALTGLDAGMLLGLAGLGLAAIGAGVVVARRRTAGAR